MSERTTELAERIGGRYLLKRELGRGGMGVVYLALDSHLMNRQVVVKVLQYQPGYAGYLEKKFADERAALARINHPGVVGVLDAGRMPDHRPFLVLQYIEGVTLKDLIPPGGMALPLAATVLFQMGAALAAAHEKGVCHRDLKPENIMLQYIGSEQLLVKVIDFGIARLSEWQGEASGIVAGTVPYMAPEQLLGKAERASDIYALGVVLWQMLTGETVRRMSERAERRWTDRLCDVRPEISADTSRLIAEALHLDPSHRPQEIQAFATAVANSLLTAAPRPARDAPPASLPKRQMWWLGAIASLASLAGMGLYSYQSSVPTLPPASAAPQTEFAYLLNVRDAQGRIRSHQPGAAYSPEQSVQFVAVHSSDCFVYLINEGPGGWVWMHPGFRRQEFSYFAPDNERGSEKVHIVWSVAPLPALEKIRSAVLARVQRDGPPGSALSPGEVAVVQQTVELGTRGITRISGDVARVRGRGPVVTLTTELGRL
jgi:serine/threonine protein kinase